MRRVARIARALLRWPDAFGISGRLNQNTKGRQQMEQAGVVDKVPHGVYLCRAAVLASDHHALNALLLEHLDFRKMNRTETQRIQIARTP
jgi:hypothetical protein